MRRLVLYFMLALMSLSGMGQVLSLEGKVKLLPQNIYAARNQRKDSKGFPCGVVMFHSTIEDLKFNGQMVGDVPYEAGVYYVYVSKDTRKLEAVAPSGSVLKIDLPKIEPKTTYEATLYYVYPKGTITCASDPAGATVTLISADERINLGKTPLKGNAEVLAGIYVVEISKPGFYTVVKKNIKIDGGKTTKLGTVKLSKSGKVSSVPAQRPERVQSGATRGGELTASSAVKADISSSAQSLDDRMKQKTEEILAKRGNSLQSGTNSMPTDGVYQSVEQSAEFAGGMGALMKWLSNNVIYPVDAEANDIQGKVIVKFIVDKYGRILNPQIIKGLYPSLDVEALRVVMSMPRWQAAKNGGVPVASYFTLPINFKLQQR